MAENHELQDRERTASQDSQTLRFLMAHSSIAKYCVAIISAIAIFFPSTYVFINPPYYWEGILILTVVFGVSGFVFASISIFVSEFGRNPNYFRRLRDSRVLSGYAALLTLCFLLSIVIYVVLNAVSDYRSAPTIQSIEISPQNPIAGDLIEFSGSAVDQDRDELTWNWSVTELEEDAELVPIPGNLKTVYWPSRSGAFRVDVQVSDSAEHRSRRSSVFFVVSEYGDYEGNER